MSNTCDLKEEIIIYHIIKLRKQGYSDIEIEKNLISSGCEKNKVKELMKKSKTLPIEPSKAEKPKTSKAWIWILVILAIIIILGSLWAYNMVQRIGPTIGPTEPYLIPEQDLISCPDGTTVEEWEECPTPFPFYDDFENVYDISEYWWEYKDENWNLQRDTEDNQVLEGNNHEWIYLGKNDWYVKNFEFDMKRFSGTTHVNFLLVDNEEEFRRYYLSISEDSIILTQSVNDESEDIETYDSGISDNDWHHIQIKLTYQTEGDHINVFLDDETVIGTTHDPIDYSGYVAFETLDDTNFWFDNVYVS